MKEYITTTGTHGLMKIKDNESNIEFYLKNLLEVGVPQLSWTYSFNGEVQPLKSNNFLGGPNWQRLGVAWGIPSTTVIVFKLGDTGIPSLGGPTDFEVYIYRGNDEGTVLIKTGSMYKLAQPFVNVAGVWRPAKPYAKDAGIWKPTI